MGVWPDVRRIRIDEEKPIVTPLEEIRSNQVKKAGRAKTGKLTKKEAKQILNLA